MSSRIEAQPVFRRSERAPEPPTPSGRN